METFAAALPSHFVFLIRKISVELNFYLSGLNEKKKKKSIEEGCSRGYRHHMIPCVLQISPKV